MFSSCRPGPFPTPVLRRPEGDWEGQRNRPGSVGLPVKGWRSLQSFAPPRPLSPVVVSLEAPSLPSRNTVSDFTFRPPVVLHRRVEEGSDQRSQSVGERDQEEETGTLVLLERV